MPLNVLILNEHADLYREQLTPRFPDLIFHAVRTPDEAARFACDAEVIIAHAHAVPRELIAAAPSLKWVQALTTGTDPLTAPGVLPSHVLLTSARGAHVPQMCELALLHIIALNRNLLRMLKNQANAVWERWDQPMLLDKTVVIVGVGIIAEEIARRCAMFGMKVVGVSGGRREAPNFPEIYPRHALARVAARADFLLLLVPYTPATRHLVNREVLEAMKPSAFLINLARGGVVDEAALIDCLKAGRIAGAGIDVFSTHPLPPGSPFWKLPNVIITPNVGGQSDRFVEQTLAVVEPNLQAYVEGRLTDLRNVVER
jgi:phosphoglycerate dehydrogenase-like enzyme